MVTTLQQSLIGSNSSTIKSHNLRAILLMLLRSEYISRARLAELTGLSTTTITNLIAELLAQGVVVEEGAESSPRRRGVGRPRMALRLVPEARYAVGVHIGVGSLQVAVADLRAHILCRLRHLYPLDKPAEAVLADIINLVNQAITGSNVRRQDIIGVGVGASGLVDPTAGVNLLAPNLGWRNVAIRDVLAQGLKLPVCVDNNVRAMALGEALFGAAQNVRVSAFVYARIGVGSGFVVDGRPYGGSNAGAGEIGHTTFLVDGGAACRCGNTGCLETLISEPAIMEQAWRLVRQGQAALLADYLGQVEQPGIEQVFAAARAGDKTTRRLLDKRAGYMGVALANLVNILNPELILVGGIFFQGQDLLLPAMEQTMRQRAFANLGERVRLQPTSFGRQAGVIGAAALALTNFFYQQNDLPSLYSISEAVL
jgi:predicted NBD/HSP70 family sugar kinase